jgi:hypothetical protein
MLSNNMLSNNMMSQQAYGGYGGRSGGFGGGGDDGDKVKCCVHKIHWSKWYSQSIRALRLRRRMWMICICMRSRMLPRHSGAAPCWISLHPLKTLTASEFCFVPLLFCVIVAQIRNCISIHEAELSLGTSKTADNPSVDVWHSIKLTNTAKAPWTTGPALVVKGAEQSLVCQSSVSFTPVGLECKVKLTKALSVSVAHEESLVPNTKTVTKTFYSTEYVRVDVTGSLLLRNLKTTELKLLVTLTVTGELVSSSIAPVKKVESASSDVANSTWVVVLERVLQPKESFSVKYTRTYFRRQ